MHVLVILLCFVLPGTLSQNLTKEEYHLLPPAFHLDNYERCLSQDDGLYCLGTFQLIPEKEPNHIYDLMKKYSNSGQTFNRTLIRRGYCVSSRCPSAERNASLRFERCAARWGQARALRTSLRTLHYCRSAGAQRFDSSDQSYADVLYAVYTLLTLNLIGTVYDFMTDENVQRNRLLLFWSARTNWHRLTGTNEHGDPRLAKLAPIQGYRILAIASMLYVHASVASFKLYVYNPQFLEQTLKTLLGSFLSNSAVLVQVFVIISTFLTTYNLLLYSQKNPLSFKLVPLSVVKRLTRITPLYLLVMGYALTWWNRPGDSPLWSAVIGGESKICREKFWYHMLYVSNLIEPNRGCLMQTWFLAADMQLNILTSVLVITLAKFRGRAIKILGCMSLVACVFTSIMAYIFEWKPVNQVVTPEKLRILFADEDPSLLRSASFTRIHLATWGYLHAAFLGQALAFLHYEMQERGIKESDYKWLPFIQNIGFPMMVAWTFSGLWTREHTSRLVSAMYVGVERLVCGAILGSIVFTGINNDGNLTRFFAWRGWNVMGRMSLSVMLVHWCINLIIIIARPNTAPVSLISFAVDAVTTGFFTYLIAVPLTILVEMPTQKTLDYIIFERLLKLK